MKPLERIRNYWRRWGLHKAEADAQMWEKIAEEERERREAAERRRYPPLESYQLKHRQDIP